MACFPQPEDTPVGAALTASGATAAGSVDAASGSGYVSMPYAAAVGLIAFSAIAMNAPIATATHCLRAVRLKAPWILSPMEIK
jgi:hypothetical protein